MFNNKATGKAPDVDTYTKIMTKFKDELDRMRAIERLYTNRGSRMFAAEHQILEQLQSLYQEIDEKFRDPHETGYAPAS